MEGIGNSEEKMEEMSFPSLKRLAILLYSEQQFQK
jgi:hypothetical protein